MLPSKLSPGDTVAFISPSGRVNTLFPNRVARAVKHFENKGYKVKVIFNEQLSNDFQEAVRQRVDEIHQAFLDPEVKAIVCTIGGLNANELLRHIDYSVIKKHPKIFCGYSDITLLHHAIWTKTGLTTFYGPAAIPQYGEYPEPLSFSSDHFFHVVTNASAPGQLPQSKEWTDHFLDWMSPDSDSQARRLKPNPGWRWLKDGKAQGRLMGGCLPSCAQLFGTPYRPSFKGCILFLELPDFEPEPEGMPVHYARAFLADYIIAGVLDDIVGMVWGRPLRYNEEQTKEFEAMLLDQCKPFNFPILANIDLGHTDPILSLPFNSLAELDSSRGTFAILEAAVA